MDTMGSVSPQNSDLHLVTVILLLVFSYLRIGWHCDKNHYPETPYGLALLLSHVADDGVHIIERQKQLRANAIFSLSFPLHRRPLFLCKQCTLSRSSRSAVRRFLRQRCLARNASKPREIPPCVCGGLASRTLVRNILRMFNVAVYSIEPCDVRHFSRRPSSVADPRAPIQ